MLAVSGDTAAAGLGQYCGVVGNPGGDLLGDCLALAAIKALAASDRRRSDGDSTGDFAPSSIFCSNIFVGVEQFEGFVAGVEEGEFVWEVWEFLGGVKAPE